MKQLLLFLILGLLNINSWAQGTNSPKSPVRVKYLDSYEAALKEAQQTNKPIFFNCYADWAIPCRGMDEAVFSNEEFAQWLNKNFVCLKLEVTDPKNQNLVEKYQIRFFAHFIILDPQGKLIHRIVGGDTLPAFKELVARSLDYKTSLAGMNERYAKGERNISFLRDYIDVLGQANEGEKQDSLIKEYIQKIDTSDLIKKNNWSIFYKVVEDIHSDYFNYLLRHYTEFVQENGEKEVKQLISLFSIRALYPYLFNTAGYEKMDMQGLHNMMSKYLDSTDVVFSYFEAVKARGEDRITDFIELLKKYGHTWQTEIWRYADLNLASAVKQHPELKDTIENYLNDRIKTIQEPSVIRSYQNALLTLANDGKGVKFEEVSFNEALALAAKNNKLVFMDCYTSWCGPCKMLADRIFPLKEVGEFFNQHFINIKMDMEKGEGKDLAKRYHVTSFPTLLVLDAKGNIVHRLSGARPAKELVELMSRALSEETAYAPVKAKYDSGDRTPQVVGEYLLNMRLTGEMNDAAIQKEASDYFINLSEEQRLDKEMIPFFKNFAIDPENEMSLYFLANHNTYNSIGKEFDPEEILLRIYFPALMNYLPDANLQDERLIKLMEAVKHAGYVKEKRTLGYLVRLIEAVGNNNWKSVKKLYTKEIGKMTDMRGQLNLDVLWNRLWIKTPTEMKADIIEYLKAERAKTIQSSIDNYDTLIKKLENA